MCSTSRWSLLLLWLVCVSSTCLTQQNPSLRVTVADHQGASIPDSAVHIVGLDRIGIPAPNGTVLFKDIPPGSYSVSIVSAGFKDKVVTGIVVTIGKTTEVSVILEQAPPKASDYKISEALPSPRLYAKQLTGIGQPLLCPDSVSTGSEWYRFLWVPTFSPPVFIRIDIQLDGTAELLTYTWKGQGGYDWGKQEKVLRKLTSEEEGELFYSLADIGFWSLPAEVDLPPNVVVLDGTEWFFEGVKGGNCHVVRRYSSPLSSLVARQFLGAIAKVKPYSNGDQ